MNLSERLRVLSNWTNAKARAADPKVAALEQNLAPEFKLIIGYV